MPKRRSLWIAVLAILLLSIACSPFDILAVALKEATRQLSAPDRKPSVVSDRLQLNWTYDAPFLTSSHTFKVVSASGVVLMSNTDSFSVPRVLTHRAETPTTRLRYPAIAGPIMRLTASDDYFFLGTDLGSIIAINPQDLNMDWWNAVQFPSAFTDLSVADGFVFADTYWNNNFALDASTGQVKSERLPIGTVGWNPETHTIIRGHVQAYSLADDQVLWSEVIPGSVEIPPIVTRDRVVTRGGPLRGRVAILDRSNGDMIGESTLPVIGTLDVGYRYAYGVAVDGSLRAWHLDTGEEETLVTFGSSPVRYSGEHLEGYYVSVDRTSGMIYSYLGDSSQLFAFSFESDEF